MAVYRLSAKAASDLDTIYEYTILRFGLDQARVYLFGLQEQFQILAEQPAHGRQADALARGLRRVGVSIPHHLLHACETRYSDRSCAAPAHGCQETCVTVGEGHMSSNTHAPVAGPGRGLWLR